MTTNPKLHELRRTLLEKFPEAHAARFSQTECFTTGLPCLDRIGLPKGSLIELVAPRPSSGSMLLLTSLLQSASHNRYPLAFIDGHDSFDPQSAGQSACHELLWVRCQKAQQAIKAADLILRDGNLPFAILDLQLNALNELRRIANPVWFRLQSLTRRSSAVCLVMTSRALVGSPRLRLHLGESYQLSHLEQQPKKLLHQISLNVQRRRRSPLPDQAGEHSGNALPDG